MTTLLTRLALLEEQRSNLLVAREYAAEALLWSRRLGMVDEQTQVEAQDNSAITPSTTASTTISKPSPRRLPWKMPAMRLVSIEVLARVVATPQRAFSRSMNRPRKNRPKCAAPKASNRRGRNSASSLCPQPRWRPTITL